MKISVAMTTYNGERFIKEQLDSIKNQTLPPDEVIICDDISNDSSTEIISSYIKSYKLNNWKMVINPQKLGWKQNFRQSIGLTTGDCIFFSDQDDIWNANKIEVMSALMEELHAGCIYGDSIKIDDIGNPLRERNIKGVYSGQVKKIAFTPSFFSVGGLGCCMCVSRGVADKYLEINLTKDDHDSQCPRIAVFFASLWYFDSPVIRYRIHSENTSGISKVMSFGTSNLNHRIEDIKTNLEWLNIIKGKYDYDEMHSEYLESAINLQNRRIEYFNNESNFCQLLKFYKLYGSISMIVGDFAYKNNINSTLGRLRWWLEKTINFLRSLQLIIIKNRKNSKSFDKESKMVKQCQ